MQITRTGFQNRPQTLAAVQNDFGLKRCAVIRGFLPRELAKQVAVAIDTEGFEREASFALDGRRLATEMTIHGSNLWVHALNLLMSDRRLFNAVEEVTGCPKIGCFRGRISRHIPSSDHNSDWHDDRDREGARLVGLSVNLSIEPYVGGKFLMRRKGQSELLADISHTQPGDAHMFAIDATLQHRVTGVDGVVPRTAFVGWFQAIPDTWAVIRGMYAPASDAWLDNTESPDIKSYHKMGFSQGGRFVVSDGIISQEISGSVVLLNMLTRKYYLLNGIGAEIWRLVAEGCEFSTITDTIGRVQSRDSSSVSAQVHALVSRLIDARILVQH